VPLRLVGQDPESTPTGHAPALARLQAETPDEKAVPDYIAQLLGQGSRRRKGSHSLPADEAAPALVD
jgi:hypothetical protein